MIELLQKHNQTSIIDKEEIHLAWDFISDLDIYYPDISTWFFQKVCPDLSTHRRRIILKKSADKIVGIAILKKYPTEQKICTFRISDNFKGMGIGTELMLDSVKWLGVNHPLITVNEESFPEFSGFLERFNFYESTSIMGLYRPNRTEFFYNHVLTHYTKRYS